jgi:hypothetical protein
MAREQGAIFFSPSTMTEMTRLVHVSKAREGLKSGLLSDCEEPRAEVEIIKKGSKIKREAGGQVTLCLFLLVGSLVLPSYCALNRHSGG